MDSLISLENIKNIKYKLSIYNKVNYYQLLIIEDINSTIINIINNYNLKKSNNTKYYNIILFNLFYKKILETNTQNNIITIDNDIYYEDILNKYNVKGNILFLSNYNNIFSKKWTKQELHDIFNKYNNLLFIIDETFTNNNLIYSCVDCINLFHNILIIKTLDDEIYTNIKYIVSNVKLINKISK
jgi:hypothetical protein